MCPKPEGSSPAGGPDPRLAGLRYFDHQDHTASAYFAQAALADYWGRSHRRRPAIVENYLGYEVGGLPDRPRHRGRPPEGRAAVGLRLGGQARLRRPGRLRRPQGGRHGLQPAEPAELDPLHPAARSRLQRLDPPRQGRPARRLRRARRQGRCWTETAPGSGSFIRPSPWAANCCRGRSRWSGIPDGTLQLFACRTVLPGRNAAHRREVMTAVQTGSSPDGCPPSRAGNPSDPPTRSRPSRWRWDSRRRWRPGTAPCTSSYGPGTAASPAAAARAARSGGCGGGLRARPGSRRRRRRSPTGWMPGWTPRGGCMSSPRRRHGAALDVAGGRALAAAGRGHRAAGSLRAGQPRPVGQRRGACRPTGRPDTRRCCSPNGGGRARGG